MQRLGKPGLVSMHASHFFLLAGRSSQQCFSVASHGKEGLIEKVCAGIWKSREGNKLHVPTIREVERAVDSRELMGGGY